MLHSGSAIIPKFDLWGPDYSAVFLHFPFVCFPFLCRCCCSSLFQVVVGFIGFYFTLFPSFIWVSLLSGVVLWWNLMAAAQHSDYCGPALPLSHPARVFIAGDDRKKKKEGKKKRRTSLQLVNGLADEALVGAEWPINQAARHVSWMRFSDADIISLTRLCRH